MSASSVASAPAGSSSVQPLPVIRENKREANVCSKYTCSQSPPSPGAGERCSSQLGGGDESGLGDVTDRIHAPKAVSIFRVHSNA